MTPSSTTFPFYLKFTCTLVSIIAIGYLAAIGQFIFVPFILGSLIALFLLPVCNFFERRCHIPRTLSAIVTLLLFFSFVGTVFTLIGSQLSQLMDDWPAFEKQITSGFEQFQSWVQQTFHIAYNAQIQYITDAAATSISKGTALVGVALLSLSSLFILAVFTLLYTFFILIYRGHILRFLLLLNHEKHHPVVWDIVQQVQYVVKKYIIGLAIQMCLVALLSCVALSVIGVKYSIMLGIIMGIFNILPYIGFAIALLVTALITFATSSMTHVLLVFVALVIIHLIDSNLIVPKIVGSKVKVNSLFAMLAIIVGELLWGIPGMLLAIPVIAIIKIIFDRITELKAWGFLLGEEDNHAGPYVYLMKLLTRSRKQ